MLINIRDRSNLEICPLHSRWGTESPKICMIYVDQQKLTFPHQSCWLTTWHAIPEKAVLMASPFSIVWRWKGHQSCPVPNKKGPQKTMVGDVFLLFFLVFFFPQVYRNVQPGTLERFELHFDEPACREEMGGNKNTTQRYSFDNEATGGGCNMAHVPPHCKCTVLEKEFPLENCAWFGLGHIPEDPCIAYYTYIGPTLWQFTIKINQFMLGKYTVVPWIPCFYHNLNDLLFVSMTETPTTNKSSQRPT